MTAAKTPPTSKRSREIMKQEVNLLYPLDEFYARAGLALPVVAAVSGEEMPEPYRGLLVHERDMTPTLESFHGERIHIRVLDRRQISLSYAREVVLELDESGRIVEFGAIVIHLEHFPPAAREEVLGGHTPLGAILAQHEIAHVSRPCAFIQVAPDVTINQALGLSASQGLYGRRNVISNPAGHALADIVEILPPTVEVREHARSAKERPQ